MTWIGTLVDRWIWAKRSFPSLHPPEVLIARLEKQADAVTDYGDLIGIRDVAYELKGRHLKLRFRHPAPISFQNNSRGYGYSGVGGKGALRRDFYGEIVELSSGSLVRGAFRWQTPYWVGFFLYMVLGIVSGTTWWGKLSHPSLVTHRYIFTNFIVTTAVIALLIIYQTVRGRVCERGAEGFLTQITTEP
jgi:hypothetical protein